MLVTKFSRFAFNRLANAALISNHKQALPLPCLQQRHFSSSTPRLGNLYFASHSDQVTPEEPLTIEKDPEQIDKSDPLAQEFIKLHQEAGKKLDPWLE